MTRSLTVWWDGEVVGSLALDRQGATRFAYAPGWLAEDSAPPVSFSLPKRQASFSTRECLPFFEGLLPEGAQRDAVAAVLGVSSGNTFGLRPTSCEQGTPAGEERVIRRIRQEPVKGIAEHGPSAKEVQN